MAGFLRECELVVGLKKARVEFLPTPMPEEELLFSFLEEWSKTTHARQRGLQWYALGVIAHLGYSILSRLFLEPRCAATTCHVPAANDAYLVVDWNKNDLNLMLEPLTNITQCKCREESS